MDDPATKPRQSSAVPAPLPMSPAEIARRTAIVLAIVAAAAVLWFARTAVLLLFAGILLAVLLDGMCRPLMRWTGMAKGAALSVVLVAIAAFFVILGWSAGPVLIEQLKQLAADLTKTVTSFGQEAAEEAEGGLLHNLDWSQLIALLPSPLGIASGATAVASTVFGALTAFLIVIFFGVYLALDPDFYLRLVLKAAPAQERAELREVLTESGVVLHKWLNGQLFAMAIVGGITYVGLLILAIPLAFALALLLGLFEFIPYIGPILGAGPMLLISAGQGLDMLMWVFGLYLIVQLLESYVLTPLIQSRAVSRPPVVVIASQLAFGAMFGVLGLAIATPLAAAASVPIRRYLGNG
jgi:predicted PurR-regulated permease PerM